MLVTYCPRCSHARAIAKGLAFETRDVESPLPLGALPLHRGTNYKSPLNILHTTVRRVTHVAVFVLQTEA